MRLEDAVPYRAALVAASAITFTTIDDVFSFANIPYPLWDRIRDRAVVIAG